MTTLYLPIPVVANEFHVRYRTTIEGVGYQIEYHYNPRSNTWSMDWLSGSGDPIIRGVPLVADEEDILGKWKKALALPQGKLKLTVLDDEDPGPYSLGNSATLSYETQG